MKLTFAVFRLLVVLVLCGLSTIRVQAQNDVYIWDEKWPVNIPITPENALVVYLQSNFGKIGELAADQLRDLLNDPVMQAKLSVQAIEYLKRLHADSRLSNDDKARQFIADIEADIASYVGAPSGGLNAQVGFSGSFGIARLSWDRRLQRIQCQRNNCVCPNGSRVPGPFFTCQTQQCINGVCTIIFVQPNCTFPIDVIDEEAEYKIYRNNKLLVTYAGVRSIANQSQSFSFGFLRTTVGWTSSPDTPSGRATPFYDYDPYNTPIGTPVHYRVEALSRGCGSGYNNELTGIGGGGATVTLDADGDGRPDFFPADILAEKRAVGAFPGTKVSEYTDATGKVTVAVFERASILARQIWSDFSVAVPSDYVVVGGGGEGVEMPYGSLLTASYPDTQLQSWQVSMKDHKYANAVNARVWAIGMKVAGLSRQQLRDQMTLTTVRGPSAQHPNVSTSLATDFVMLGGGFKVNWVGQGNLGTATYPDGANVWRAKSKDHVFASPATLDAFAIGVKRVIPGIGTMVTDTRSATSAVVPHPSINVAAGNGYALVGCGAHVNWQVAGNLLWRVKPNASTRACELASRDIDVPSPASITGYALGVTIN